MARKKILALPRYGKGKHALKRAIEKGVGRFAVIGRPGIGKSVITGRLLYQYVRRKWDRYNEIYSKYIILRQAGAKLEEPKSPLPCAVAVNLRQQIRVWTYAFRTSGVYKQELYNEWIVIEPKHILCEKKVIRKSDSLSNILEKCLFCELKGKCKWYQQFKQPAKIYIVSHEQLPVLLLTKQFKFDVLVIDEADTLYDAFAHEIPKKKVDEILRKLKEKGAEKEAKEIERRFQQFYDYYEKLDIYVPRWLYPRARVILELTATAPYEKSLYEYLTGGFEWYVSLDEEESEESAQAEEHDYTRKFQGYILLKEETNLDTLLINRNVYYVRDRELWIHELANIIEYIIKELGKEVGITVPNYEINHILTDILRDKQIDVFTDYDFRNVSDYERLWKIYKSYGGKPAEIVTIAGRFSRGVSMREKEVIIGMFQRTTKIRISKKHLDILEERSDKMRDIPPSAKKLRQFFNSAESLQALFRFNRKPSQPHLVVLYDARLETAFKSTSLRYYYEEATKHYFSTADELKNLLRILT